MGVNTGVDEGYFRRYNGEVVDGGGVHGKVIGGCSGGTDRKISVLRVGGEKLRFNENYFLGIGTVGESFADALGLGLR